MTDTTGKHLETEQKYDAAADFVMPDLAGLGERTKAAGRQRYYLSATYYDTDELDLIKNRITLRRRVGGPDEGWHLKLPVRKDTRQEIRTPLAEGDHGTVPARLAAQVQDITAGRPLHPIAILDTERTVVTLADRAGQPLAEVADDLVTAARLDRTRRGADEMARDRGRGGRGRQGGGRAGGGRPGAARGRGETVSGRVQALAAARHRLSSWIHSPGFARELRGYS